MTSRQPKTTERRVAEAVQLRSKIVGEPLFLPADHPQVARLLAALCDFVRGDAFTGIIDLTDFGRRAVCTLSTRDDVVSTIVLKCTRRQRG